MTFVSRISLQKLVNLIFSVIGEVFLNVPQILPAAHYVTLAEKRRLCLVNPIIFHWEAGNPGSQWPVSFL